MIEQLKSSVAVIEVDAILFDLDGTLVDSAPDLGLAANKMRMDRGLAQLPLLSYRPFVGTGARGMILVAFDLTEHSVGFDALKEEFFSNYQQVLTKQTGLFEGVQAVIDTIIYRGMKWGVVTNKSARFTMPLTQAMAIFASAGTIVSGDTTPHAKPHPAPLLFAAAELGVVPHRCLYVGDDERDIAAGKAAGMATVTAAYGYLGPNVDHRQWAADATIEMPLDLLPLLKLQLMP